MEKQQIKERLINNMIFGDNHLVNAQFYIISPEIHHGTCISFGGEVDKNTMQFVAKSSIDSFDFKKSSNIENVKTFDAQIPVSYSSQGNKSFSETCDIKFVIDHTNVHDSRVTFKEKTIIESFEDENTICIKTVVSNASEFKPINDKSYIIAILYPRTECIPIVRIKDISIEDYKNKYSSKLVEENLEFIFDLDNKKSEPLYYSLKKKVSITSKIIKTNTTDNIGMAMPEFKTNKFYDLYKFDEYLYNYTGDSEYEYHNKKAGVDFVRNRMISDEGNMTGYTESVSINGDCIECCTKTKVDTNDQINYLWHDNILDININDFCCDDNFNIVKSSSIDVYAKKMINIIDDKIIPYDTSDLYTESSKTKDEIVTIEFKWNPKLYRDNFGLIENVSSNGCGTKEYQNTLITTTSQFNKTEIIITDKVSKKELIKYSFILDNYKSIKYAIYQDASGISYTCNFLDDGFIVYSEGEMVFEYNPATYEVRNFKSEVFTQDEAYYRNMFGIPTRLDKKSFDIEFNKLVANTF